MKYYRITYNSIGIYEALKKELFKNYHNPEDIWNKLKQSSSFNWLKIPDNYTNSSKSYFTAKGLDQFKNKTYATFIKYLNPQLIEIKEYDIDKNNIIYEDEYRIVIEEIEYNFINATIDDIDYLKDAKLYNIFNYANNLEQEEIDKIIRYVDNNISKEIKDYKIITYNNKRIGCYLVLKKDDGVILEEIYLENKYRNKGIGTNIIKDILKHNPIVYLWVYKDNKKALSLYKKLGFNILEETETRYYMEYKNNHI